LIDQEFHKMQHKGGDLPEWGSAAKSYGRPCMTKAPRQLGVDSNGGGGSNDNCSKSGQGGCTRAGERESASNKTSSDNPLALCHSGSAFRNTRGPDDGVLMLPAVSGGSEGAAADNNSCVRGSCLDMAVPDWTCATVEQWLAGMSLGCLSERFLEEAIDGEALLELQEEDLAFLGVTKLGIRRKLMKQIKLLQARAPQTVGFERIPVVNPSALSSSSRSSSRHGHDSNVRTPDCVNDQVGHKRHDMSKVNGGLEPLQVRGTADGSVSQSKGPRSHDGALPSDDRGNRGCGSPGLDTGRSGSAKVSGKGKAVGDGTEKNGNHTSPDHPLAFGSRWGTSQYTDGPFNGPEMRSRKRALWKDLPPPSV